MRPTLATKHPLWTLPDEEFYELMARANVASPFVMLFEDARRGCALSDSERQEVLARWHGVVPQPEGFRWPWPSLDRQVGLLPAGDLAVVLAQTGSGKTTFTSSLINRMAKTPTLVFATEIPDDRYLTLLAARRAGLHPDKVVQGLWREAGYRMSEDTARARYEQEVQLLSRSALTIAPHLRLRASALRDTLLREADIAQPKLVVLDHFQAVVHDLGDGISGVQATLEVLQEFALEERVAVVVTNQAHVRGQGMTPRPTDCVTLAGVFGGQVLGQAASHILGVHRVFADVTRTGIAITPEFLKGFRQGNGKESELWDRNAVGIDLLKIRYDAHGAVGTEIKLAYRDGQYWEFDELQAAA